jgi:deoxyribodipyrimidine photo-lyase
MLHDSLPPAGGDMPGIEQLPAAAPGLRGGYHEASRLLDNFIMSHLRDYDHVHNDPAAEGSSGLLPWIHFGQISSLEIALKVVESGIGAGGFLEQLIVRRELAFNHVFYNERYDSFDGLPEWALKTLEQQAMLPRPYHYTRRQLEEAQTHDRWWNAAQHELVHTGRQHNYMRMYWGKKILEWSAHPREAFDTALYLNNRYAFDGRDPNSYTGVAWCFGRHDRPWGARPVFGTVRCMTAGGLQRKLNMARYESRVAEAVRGVRIPEP